MSEKLDDETERLIRGVMTTFRPEHPAHIALRNRIRELVEEARDDAFRSITETYQALSR